MKIFIADNDAMFRRFLRRVLESQPDCQLVGESSDLNQTLDEFAKTNPDLVFVGLSLPYRGGLEATRRIKSIRPATRVVVLSEATGEAYRQAAASAGAERLLLKNDEIVTILRALRAAEPPAAQRSA